jgi:hypothetical protein
LIFFVDYYNEYANFDYLESALEGWSGQNSDPTATWAQVSLQNTTASGANYRKLGSGLQNTLAIIGQGNSTTSSSAAAWARSYNGGGKSDWYLPSVSELQLMFQVLSLRMELSYFVPGGAYWSSTQLGPDQAMQVEFRTGYLGYTEKSNLYKVRPIRSF